ncbi:MAG: hypothetical protein ACJAYE_000417 [Candidatus Azotimanducaceae bacterium]|jgi:hypothetical protein
MNMYIGIQQRLHRKILFVFLLFMSSLAAAESLRVPGGKLNIDWRSNFSDEEKARLRVWLSHAAESASLLSGRFPRQETNILVQRAKRGKGPVPWAHTIRHTEPEGVSFHVDPSASTDALIRDWTATHEFSHLFLPYPGREDIWISEGFASYYQNILMMRKGTLSEQQGWQKIADGFARGEADPNQGVSLQTVSREMRERRAFKRVYWSGALYFFEADLVLRQQGQSLDQVITEFALCCKHQAKEWNGTGIALALDQAAKRDLFSPLYALYQQTKHLPDYHTMLERIGVSIVDKRVILNTDVELARLRQAISLSPRKSP